MMLLITSWGNSDLINDCPGENDCLLIVSRGQIFLLAHPIGGVQLLNGIAQYIAATYLGIVKVSRSLTLSNLQSSGF